MRYRYSRSRRRTLNKVLVTVGVILGIAAAVAGVIFATRFWSVGQWIVGGIAAVAVMGFFFFIKDNMEKEIKALILWLVTIPNGIAGCIWPDVYAIVCALIAAGCTMASIYVVCDYMEDWDIGESFVAFMLMPCNIMAALCAYNGVNWLTLFYFLAVVIATAIIWGVICWILDASCAGRKFCKNFGRITMNIMSLALVGLHLLLCWKMPHLIHAMDEYPMMLAHRLEGADGLCSCGEVIDVDGGVATWVHSISCDRLKPSLEANESLMEEPIYINREVHWSECDCGFVLWQEAHVYDENGVCMVCYWEQEQPAEEPNPEEQETQEQEEP